MMKRRSILSLFAFLLIVQSVYAWNALGHKVVCDIAWKHADQETRQEIADILRRHPEFDKDFAKRMPVDIESATKAQQDRWVFAHAGTWPDIARGSKYDHPTWHYVNYPIYLDQADRELQLDNVVTTLRGDWKKYNVVQSLQSSLHAALDESRDAPTRAVAYSWLFHLVGDVHQPLHAVALYSRGQFPKGDRGGNSIKLTRGKNLHSLWDGLLGTSVSTSNVRRKVYQLEQLDNAWNASTNSPPTQWAKESYDLARSYVYDPIILNAVRATTVGGKVPPIDLPDQCRVGAGELARHRIIAAGVRLASLLGGTVTIGTGADGNEFDLPLGDESVGDAMGEPYWLNLGSNVRHNRSCQWFGNTKRGRYCTTEEGKPCGECGG